MGREIREGRNRLLIINCAGPYWLLKDLHYRREPTCLDEGIWEIDQAWYEVVLSGGGVDKRGGGVR